MKLLLDMNVSPAWVSVLVADGHQAVHLEQGALVSVDRAQSRARVLPLG